MLEQGADVISKKVRKEKCRMATCWFCKAKKGKRYCAPLENVLCPICCAENRLEKIDCIEQCGYLKGVAFQRIRELEQL